jgi:predicted site-specific integrase-resolvase
VPNKLSDMQRLIPLTEAAQELGTSRVTMARLAREGRFTVYENPLDRRQKLVDRVEIREMLQPQPHRGFQSPVEK